MADQSASKNPAPPPLHGVRVIEVSYSRPARIAGQLLADLGADVVRLVVDGSSRPETTEPGNISWDRGKRVMNVEGHYTAAHVHEADIVIVDESPSALFALGLSSSQLNPKDKGFVHVWVPPYGHEGEWAELDEDPLLVAAAGGVAGQYAGAANGPIAPVVSNITQVHGGLAAAAALAGLHGLERTGYGYSATISGLHAASAVLTAMTFNTIDQPTIRRSGGGRAPTFRSYQGSDKQWFYLAALTPDLVLRTLDALDRLDLLALPEVEGDFYRLMSSAEALAKVNIALEDHFAAQPSTHWIDLLSEHGLAAAPVNSREEWTESDIVAANGGFVIEDDERVGPVRMPTTPIIIDGSAPAPGRLPATNTPTQEHEPLWEGSRPARPVQRGDYLMPLNGIKVIDAASFIAGPFVSSVLSEYGADVIRIEPPTGDTYRAFPIQFLSVNRYKRGLALDVPSPEGAHTMLELLRDTDILVENLRPARMERIGLGDAALAKANSQLIHVGVSAYGLAEAWADSPGFDPIFQARSGMSTAQGGDGYPYDSGVPTIDTATGILGAIAALASLHRRFHHTIGADVGISLAQGATFIQFCEFTTYPGSPPPAIGKADYRGPSDFHRLYECEDGWIALNADRDDKQRALLKAFDVTHASQLESLLRTQDSANVVAKLSSIGVDAVRALSWETSFTDAFALANQLTYVVEHKQFGRAAIVRSYSDWSTTLGRREPASFEVGEESLKILSEAGLSEQRITELLNSGVVESPKLSRPSEA
ncbi:MAG: CoA transferase [Actinomycetota bacterium]|nr:CoA transferase [Actinomycetota bacterium]